MALTRSQLQAWTSSTNLLCFLQQSFFRASVRTSQKLINRLPVFLDSSNECVAILFMLGVVNPLSRFQSAAVQRMGHDVIAILTMTIRLQA